MQIEGTVEVSELLREFDLVALFRWDWLRRFSHLSARSADERTVPQICGGGEMIRQAINCDMCGAEKLEATSHWFVAYEQGGELKLRGWESPKNSRKDVKHICGQKCAQRLVANFTAAVMVEVSAAGKSLKEDAGPEKQEFESLEAYGREEMPILERMGYDRETAAMIEADSWAGPVRPKEKSSWETEKPKSEREGLIHAARLKSQAIRPVQRMA
jgi:hypothetical protein